MPLLGKSVIGLMLLRLLRLISGRRFGDIGIEILCIAGFSGEPNIFVGDKLIGYCAYLL